MKRTILITAATAMLAAASAFAQANQVGQRRENQQDRIAQGVQSGSLTAGETANLEKKEASINQEVRADRSLNGGHLTGQEKKIVNGQQNNLSNQIYRDKHNANAAHYGNNKVAQRRENQQDRIAQGIKSGSLNAGQTARLEKGESNINHEIAADRAANGGKLTAGQKAQVNKQQNAMSGKIYRAKH
jgi:metal-dependent amidase/aminoacylase/carboxypeptidase family protein